MSNTFATVILPCVIIGTLAVLFICQVFYSQKLEAELNERQAENPAIPLFRQAIERLGNERKEIEVRLFGEIRHASMDEICARIDNLKDHAMGKIMPDLVNERIMRHSLRAKGISIDDPQDAAGIAKPIVKSA